MVTDQHWATDAQIKHSTFSDRIRDTGRNTAKFTNLKTWELHLEPRPPYYENFLDPARPSDSEDPALPWLT